MLVPADCSHRTPLTEGQGHNRNLFPTVLKAGKSKFRVLGHVVSVESSLPDSCLVAVPSHSGRAEGALGTWIRALTPFVSAPPS